MKTSSPLPVIFALTAFLVGLNLRPVLSAVGPLFPQLKSEFGLSGIQFSLLTTLPVIMMGLAALGGPVLQRRTGSVRGVVVGLALMALACLLRKFSLSSSWLIATALLAGTGIGMVQALLPALIKQDYARYSATLMSLFSTGIMAGAAVAAATAVPLSSAIGIENTFAVAGLPALLALGVWGVQIRRSAAQPMRQHRAARLSGHAWLLMLFFGIGTGAYTLVLAWLPPLYIQAGWSARSSGYILAGLTLTEVVAGFMVTALVHRFPDRRGLLIMVLMLLLAGLVSLIVAPGTTPILSTLLLGAGIGALFPLSLTVTLDHAATPSEAGRLLAFVQGGGYLLAALMPFIAGVVQDQTDSLSTAWGIMSVGVIVLIAIALRLRPLNK
ncbi:MFS transporter [Pantoea alhagi]|uniref:MFS transporter n=1 Tax=Pantoea alhagi TaxID=1891675 RepID=A0A1W6B6M9_9GAMM|nr:MFS transporter [Pantoea alhagi]ARJ42703.1 MFS transporter [Pantoea alhagi]